MTREKIEAAIARLESEPALKLTLGEVYDPAMYVEDQALADRYFAALVAHLRKLGIDSAPEKVARENLGYWAGYYGGETRARVERLFRCAHPVFGAIAENGPPTPEQAFAAGQRLARGGRP